MSAAPSSSPRSAALAGVSGLFLLALSSCASTTEPIPPCCYTGDVQLTHVRDVRLALSNGDQIRFSQAFPGYEPQSGILTTAFPFTKVEIARVTYGDLQPVLPQYDANGNGNLEEPELTVLYIREAALGLGLNVDHVSVGDRADALVLPTGEAGGLVRYVNGNFDRMSPTAQGIFQKLAWVGRDLRNKGSENDGRDAKRTFVP